MCTTADGKDVIFFSGVSESTETVSSDVQINISYLRNCLRTGPIFQNKRLEVLFLS